jgi:hypothetical protein
MFRLLYLTAIAVAMIGWLWMLVEGIAWGNQLIDSPSPKAVFLFGASAIVKMNRLTSQRASQRVAVFPPMTVMHVPKRPRHPETPANEEEARRNPNQKHYEERSHAGALSSLNV